MTSRNGKLAAALSLAAATVLLAACGVTNTGNAVGPTEDGASFYEGQKINLVVPFDAGGASDTFSRLVGKHFPQHIDGEPAIIVENIPGGAQKNGLNAFERSEHNGLNMAMGSGGLIASTHFDKAGIQFDLADYEPVMAFGGDMVIFGSTAAGIHSLEDLRNTTQPVFYGGLELNASESARTFALEQMGLNNFKPLMGYDGGGAVTAAVMRGELTLGNSTASHYIQNVKPLEEQGDIVPLMVQGYIEDGKVVRDPAFPDVPTMLEAYEMLTGKKAEGPGWDAYVALTSAQTNLLRTYWVHGDAPEAAKKALNEAADKLVKDPSFLDESSGLLGEETHPLVGRALDDSLAQIRNLDPDTVQWVNDYVDRLNK